MLKIMGTLARSVVSQTEEAVFDANSIRILGQQLRDAAAALDLSRMELACAMAYRSSEQRAIEAIEVRLAELEVNAIEALRRGRTDLAEAAAATIAASEDERSTRVEATAKADREIARLRQLIEHARSRLNALRRGLEMARIQEAMHRAGSNGSRAVISGVGALREAEATLARITQRQNLQVDVGAAMDALDREASGSDLDERFASAGIGSQRKTSARDVMARLKSNASDGPATSSPPPTAASN